METPSIHPKELAMVQHRMVTRTTTIGEDRCCDLCWEGTPRYHYYSRTPARRDTRLPIQVVDHWSETRWNICASCSILIDDRDQGALAKRISLFGLYRDVKVAIKIVASLFETLKPGVRQPIPNAPAAG